MGAKKVEERVGVIFENADWLADAFAELDRRGIAYDPISVDDAAYTLEKDLPHCLYINCVSPSSYIRGHGQAIGYAKALLNSIEDRKLKIVNGARSFQLETSKVEQYLLLRRLGVCVPKTAFFNNRQAIRD